MTHEDANRLLDACADGELDLVTSLAVEAHVGICDGCARALSNLHTLRAALSEATMYYETPAELESRIRAAIRNSKRVEKWWGFTLRNYSWAGAGIAAILLVTIVISVRSVVPRNADLTAREVLDDHLRSLTANHLTDVLSSNQHTVKPWFDGRLNFTPPVIDLTAQGFPLIGGRLDYLDDLPVAAVVYRRREHIINLFIAPAENAANTQPSSQMRDGYSIVHWTKAGMSYWAVSSLSGAELKTFAQSVFEESLPVPSPTGYFVRVSSQTLAFDGRTPRIGYRSGSAHYRGSSEVTLLAARKRPTAMIKTETTLEWPPPADGFAPTLGLAILTPS